nr:hypothetical protein CTI12_AA466450 [Tanacetum cinerariifolium]
MVVMFTTATTSLPSLPLLKHNPIIKPSTSKSPIRTNYINQQVLPSPATVIHPIRGTQNDVYIISEANTSDQVVGAVADNGDGISVVISVLLTIAFAGLSVLTIGVIYIAVTDYLTKREKDKFEKDEAEKAKKGGKKKRVRARAGPKGFGQKINDDEDDL